MRERKRLNASDVPVEDILLAAKISIVMNTFLLGASIAWFIWATDHGQWYFMIPAAYGIYAFQRLLRGNYSVRRRYLPKP